MSEDGVFGVNVPYQQQLRPEVNYSETAERSLNYLGVLGRTCWSFFDS